MLSLLQEKRPLKRARLGPPDVYPQEAKQREDELTPTNVKHGFATTPPLADEFGTAHNSNMNASKVGSFINSILSKKEELMTLQDTMRKKQQINCKDNFWPVSPRTKTALDAWFKDLAGNKPLLSLAKKAPSFNKKEEILIVLCDNQVNMQRAVWFIKLSAAYTLSFSESKNKKRSIYDPAVEWTGNIIKFMRELLPKLHDYFQLGTDKNMQGCNNFGSGMNLAHMISTPSVSSPATAHSPLTSNTLSSSSCPTYTTNATANTSGSIVCSGSGSPISGIGSNFEDCRNALKYWKYCTRLCKYMHEESLLDRQEFLNWILELIEKIRSQISFDMSLKKLILVFALQYMPDFIQSERLSRKLAVLAAKNLALLLELGPETNSPTKLPDVSASNMEVSNSEEKTSTNSLELPLSDCNNCPHHRDIIVYFSTILQTITLECPTSLIWNGINESRALSSFCGSPLDFISLVPSQLPMPFKCKNSNENIKRQLQIAEAEIALRSKHAENRWFAEKWRSSKVNCFTHILDILDYLDTHCFDRRDKDNNIDFLYSKIFPPYDLKYEDTEYRRKKNTYNPDKDAATVKILCEWAVSNQRWGEHRAIAVALLLDKRQIEVTSVVDTDNQQNSNGPDEKDSISSGIGLISGLPVFQTILMDFLDHDAPVLEENGTIQNRIQFINLVHLFCSLIRYDVFSHNAYMHTLISRGDLLRENCIPELEHVNRNETSSVCGLESVDNKASPSHHFDDEFSSAIDFKHSEFDDSNVDDDLGKLLQNIKEKGQQSALETPDSPKIADHSHMTLNGYLISRHYIYTKHFPIPQEEACISYSNECNQRYILLFGVGKERDEKKHAVKKMSKEICKLFSKKFSIDISEGGKVKKHSRNEFNFESTTSKCKSMSYFEQHVVTSQCAIAVLEQLNGFATGNNNYLPVQEHVAFLFDLMEMALNIHSLLDFCDHILKELTEIENQLQAKKSILVRIYTTSLALYIVGILRRYHSCLLLSTEETVSVFEGLCKTIKHVNNPKECSSAERCILAYLSDLYEMCDLLKSDENETEYFAIIGIMKAFKEIYNSPEQLSAAPQSYNPHFLQELFISPKRGGRIEYHCIRQLQESTANVYSFVSNAILAVCQETDNDHLNEIAILCAELTASCNSLSEEWIAALQSICNASKKLRYPHLFEQVDIHDNKIHNSLAVFICILVARHCFSLADFVLKFALPTLAYAYPEAGEFTTDAEAGARLTCHLVLKLFKTIEIPQPRMYSVSTSPNPVNVEDSFSIKLSCDRHLLVGAHKNIPIQAVLAVIKAILIIVDLKIPTISSNNSVATSNGKRSGVNTPVHPGSTPKNTDRPADLSQILGTSDLSNVSNGADQDVNKPSSGSSSAKSLEQISLLEFANHVLKQICSQEHVLERCLKHADNLCEMIIDDMLSTKQVQRVLYMICYPEAEYNIISEMDQRSMIIRILENLEQWTLRISWLDLELMHRQIMNNQTELNNWLDTVAKAAIDVFQKDALSSEGKETYSENQSTWLIVPLISKLTPAVKGRILRVAGRALESMNFCAKILKSDNNCNSNGEERDRISSSINCSLSGFNTSTGFKKFSLNYQPFLGLILSCLNGQDEYKENLLSSLYSQLSHCLQSFTEYDSSNGFNDLQEREEMLDALQLRFSLVGGMFDTIQKNGNSTTDWAILLAQLVCQGVIDASSNRELFTTVVDMLVTLVHSTLLTDNHSERDENKKLYLNLMKKLKKEIGEKNNASIKVIRQLLPLYKQTTEVISCEPAGIDMKGNKICDMDKKQLRISDKQRISVWDILEGHKNPAPLSWVWFGAVKSERKCLAYEETHRSLKYHAHSLVKPISYFYESLPLPPEDIEPVPEKICIKDEMKPDTPSSIDQSPSAVTTGRTRGKGTTRKRKPKVSKTSPTNIPTHTQVAQQSQQPQVQSQTPQQMNAQGQINHMQMNTQANVPQFNSNQLLQQNSAVMMPQQMQGNLQQLGTSQNTQIGFMGNVPQGVTQLTGQNQQQWIGQNQYHQIQQQPQFYPHQANRFERPQHNQSKQALCNMLRQRQPNFNQNNSTSFNALQQHQQIRQTQGLQTQSAGSSVQQQFVRGGMRGITANQNQLTSNISQGLNANGILAGQQSTQNVNSQASNQTMPMAANTGIINTTSNNQNSLMNVQSASGLVGSGNVLQQNVNIGAGNSNQNVINQPTFHNFNQYQQSGIMNNGANGQVPPSNMVGSYNQLNQRGSSSDYLQQRGNNSVTNNRGQFVNPTPNVTMGNIIVQNTMQPYSRQQCTGGKPSVVSTQQQFQQQRLHHQMMQIQGGMVQSQNQTINQQQTPNLVAQLQRQLPNQQNMPVQQYQHHQAPY
ncbi:mediator of RNA polymerase II transcription subunit 12 isoform X1 [Zeugodacus cucurbitae]|uniref:mediator of RNA polymerase II transcription subunit 12 isoform X1 n=1 Tax=Zeugodacus cucurbitae TaxID=28588 RepID=UPI0023D9014C|nr:mediator of RNA polymerase II transcription subunit 12 isoform X1 [Zeugodacus cucurbitae]